MLFEINYMTNISKNTKKKKTRFFEIYIPKILKTVNSTGGITLNAKQQMNSVLCIISKLLADKTNYLTVLSEKKTISEKEIYNSVKLFLEGQLFFNADKKGKKAIEEYIKNKDEKSLSKQEKSKLYFPPSIGEKFLRNFGNNKIMISNNAPIYFSGVIEYLAYEILDNSYLQAKDKKHVRITVRDMELGVRNDLELNNFFNKQKISFLGGGIVPFIHPKLLLKKSSKYKTRNNSENTDNKSKRFKPGVVCIREMKKLQKSNNSFIIPKFTFEKIVRSIVSNHQKIKISKEVFITLQHFVEQKIIEFLQKVSFLAIHAGRVKILKSDINL
jgi:histone H3/H4